MSFKTFNNLNMDVFNVYKLISLNQIIVHCFLFINPVLFKAASVTFIRPFIRLEINLIKHSHLSAKTGPDIFESYFKLFMLFLNITVATIVSDKTNSLTVSLDE